ncbi:MAG: competence/damage-inducible protein A [Gammaproteobacteria bacterium]
MKIVAEIFSQGEEVVSGQIVDSNAAWLSQRLNDMGFTVQRHTAVGDNLEDLVGLLKEISARADCCICTGGLGPTVDDLTAEAVALAAGVPLLFDEEAMAQVSAYFARRQRPMPDSNRKQAYFPQGALRITNPNGSAPGFEIRLNCCLFVFLPGVPSEMKAMFPFVQSQLSQRFDLQPDCLVTLRTVGIGESTIQELLRDVELPTDVHLGFRASPDDVQTKLLFPAWFDEDEKRHCVERVAKTIGDYVFAIDGLAGLPGGDLVSVVDRLMKQRRLKLGVLENASGGLLAAKCHGKDWLAAAFVAGDCRQAARQLGVTLESDDPNQAARVLAYGLSAYGSDIELLQLVSRDQDGYRLYNYLQTEDTVHQQQHFLFGGQFNQTQSAILALDLLRRYLQPTCL